MKHEVITTIFSGGILLCTLCSPQQVRNDRPVRGDDCPPITIKQHSDTVAYTVSFDDTEKKQQFEGDFRKFLEAYPLTIDKRDSATGQIRIRIASAGGNKAPAAMEMLPLEPEWITETTVEKRIQAEASDAFETTATTLLPDTIVPEIGGKMKLFIQRSGFDHTFAPLVTLDVFDKHNSSAASLFTIAQPSPKKITVHINSRITDGTGRLISALDIIEAWTAFIKKYPAEGFAIFRYVEGVTEFIAGKEAVIRGFGASDQQTCYCKLTQPDHDALRRIVTDRLFGTYSRLGAFVIASVNQQDVQLVANRKTMPQTRSFPDTLILVYGEDPNPILSFSLRKYDAVVLTFQNDLAYARSTLEKQAETILISRERYFISCAMENREARRYLSSKVNAVDLLQNTVKADGNVIYSVLSDSAVAPVAEEGKPSLPAGQHYRILFRKDDAVSRKIAEKLLADLSGSGIKSSLVAADLTDYERLLVDRKYDCAVGWTSERVVSDTGEQLRLASVYFRDILSGAERIAEYHEIPLFKVNRYMLIRKPAGLYRGSVAGIYSKSHPVQ